tara:strand:- start:2113 stop:2757 length:645 start_codon:yes stop_codon:yes gene_type:complete
MDPLTLTGLIAAGAGAIGGATMTGLEAYRAITPEQKKRLQELERMEAIGMLGGDYNVAMGKQMTPVQGAMREATERMAQNVSTQDMSSGAYFRGQQAMESAAAKERSDAAKRAQVDMAQQEAMNKQELQRLQGLQKIQDDFLIYGFKDLLGQTGEIGAELTKLGLAKEEQKALIDAQKNKYIYMGKEYGLNESQTDRAMRLFKAVLDYQERSGT